MSRQQELTLSPGSRSPSFHTSKTGGQHHFLSNCGVDLSDDAEEDLDLHDECRALLIVGEQMVGQVSVLQALHDLTKHSAKRVKDLLIKYKSMVILKRVVKFHEQNTLIQALGLKVMKLIIKNGGRKYRQTVAGAAESFMKDVDTIFVSGFVGLRQYPSGARFLPKKIAP